MDWLPILIIVILIVAFIAYILLQCKKKGIRAVAIEAILKAEEQYNTTTGKERLNLAVSYVYNRLPSIVTSIFPEDIVNSIVEKLVQEIFDETKKLLDYNKEANVNEEK